MASKPQTDHLGQTFPSMSAMAKYWNIPQSTLQRRLIDMKLPIKDALTLTEEECKALRNQCQDHLGNIYPSKKAMCDAYGIDRQTFFGRKTLGWSLEKCLTEPLIMQARNSKEISDHLGNKFASKSDLCKFWGIKRSTFNARQKQNWSLEKTLTTPCKSINIEKQPWDDHLGNHYDSLNAMCRAYNIQKATFTTRYYDYKWSLEKALTEPVTIESIECNDNMGHTFPSAADMCHYYDIPVWTIQGKKLSDEQLHQKLISAFKAKRKVGSIQIIKRMQFPYYLVNTNNHEIITTFDVILDEFHNQSFMPLPNGKTQCCDLTIDKQLTFPYYEVTINNEHQTWSYWEIIQYRKNTNFGISTK